MKQSFTFLHFGVLNVEWASLPKLSNVVLTLEGGISYCNLHSQCKLSRPTYEKLFNSNCEISASSTPCGNLVSSYCNASCIFRFRIGRLKTQLENCIFVCSSALNEFTTVKWETGAFLVLLKPDSVKRFLFCCLYFLDEKYNKLA